MNNYELTPKEKKLKEKLEKVLQQMSKEGLALMSVCGGTKTSLRLLTVEAYIDFYDTRDQSEATAILQRCEKVETSDTWEGEHVP